MAPAGMLFVSGQDSNALHAVLQSAILAAELAVELDALEHN